MNRINTNLIALAIGVAFSAGAMAQAMTKDAYQAGKKQIASDYKTAKAKCRSFSGNAKDICAAAARGTEKVALADHETSYKPSVKTRYEALLAKAAADYAVAKERCDDKAGNVKDVCVTEAKAAATSAKADAKAQMKTSDANAAANIKTADARGDASSKIVAARKDATADKVDAEYKVAKEKCDAYSGSAKDNCVSQAKLQFGRS